MHSCSRNMIRSPSVVRVVRAPSGRQASSFFPTPFGSRFLTHPGFGGMASNSVSPYYYQQTEDPFSVAAPFFRMMDDFDKAFQMPSFGHLQPHQRSANQGGADFVKTFQPKFDVRETENAYELRGELPGLESNNLEVEFPNESTLVVRGKVENESSAGIPPSSEATKAVANGTAADETDNAAANTEAAKDDDAASDYSTGSYQKPSVADANEDGQEVTAEAESSADAQAKINTPTTSTAEQQVTKPETEQRNEGHYWYTERSSGSFQRVFRFPSKVDQESATANLKNGILNVTVPKTAAPTAKKITVE